MNIPNKVKIDGMEYEVIQTDETQPMTTWFAGALLNMNIAKLS
jgi:hypothetical protein